MMEVRCQSVKCQDSCDFSSWREVVFESCGGEQGLLVESRGLIHVS